MVITIGALKDGDEALVARDIAGVVQSAHAGHAITKVIIEAARLTDEEKKRAYQTACEAGANRIGASASVKIMQEAEQAQTV